jgi:SAM-dependent methyltransferase
MTVKVMSLLSRPPGASAGRASTQDSVFPPRSPHVGQDRPRLLAHVGRWGRARRWLPDDVRRVIDVGCAFGYGTAALAGRGRSRRWIAGVERDAEHLHQASRQSWWFPVVQADGAQLPFRSGTLDAVVLLDVVEHAANPSAMVAEARRVLRPGGCLVVSVPHKGLLSRLDPLNVYPALRRHWQSWPPLEPADGSASGTHRHFTLDELRAVLGPAFTVDRVARTGIGVSEVLHLSLLLVFKALLRWQGAYLALRTLHFAVYLVDDLVPAGALGYHLTLRARAR